MTQLAAHLYWNRKQRRRELIPGGNRAPDVVRSTPGTIAPYVGERSQVFELPMVIDDIETLSGFISIASGSSDDSGANFDVSNEVFVSQWQDFGDRTPTEGARIEIPYSRFPVGRPFVIAYSWLRDSAVGEIGGAVYIDGELIATGITVGQPVSIPLLTSTWVDFTAGARYLGPLRFWNSYISPAGV